MMDIKSPVAEARNEYTYSASGQKLKVVQKWNPNFSTTPVIGSGINTTSLTQAKTSDYTGNIIYENNALKRILVDGGYYEGGVYYYYLTDHLGNNRVVVNTSGTVTQINHYYPFGMHFAPGTGGELQPYKYNNKELDQMHGLNMYDYSARFYEPGIGRFASVDPHAEKYYSWSPYTYVVNNPIKFIDPDGKQGVIPSPYGPMPMPILPAAGAAATSTSGVMTLEQRSNQGRMYREAGQSLVKSVSTVVEMAPTMAGLIGAAMVAQQMPAIEGWKHQQKQDRKGKDVLDAAQAAVAKATVDNISGDMPSGDPSPKREPKGNIGKIVLITGMATAAIKETVEYISNMSKNESNKENGNNKPIQNKAPKDNNSLPSVDWNKIFNPIDFPK